MKILILGGTGAMGVHLVQLLADTDNDIYVTSRTAHKSYRNIHYIRCNARVIDELVPTLDMELWDCVIDFMQYKTNEFEKRIDALLSSTKHYIFLSSARIYAESGGKLTELSERLLDVCSNEEYLSTDEYALAKARQEDILQNKHNKNWTIIRPYITYSKERLQLGFFEKEQWLYRALQGRTILLDKRIAYKSTTLTCGEDVAQRLLSIIGKTDALGEVFQIASYEAKTWDEIADIYKKAILDLTGKQVKIKYIDDIFSTNIKRLSEAQIRYDRFYDRSFDSKKIEELTGLDSYEDINHGLGKCMKQFIDKPVFKQIDWVNEAITDRITGEFTSLSEIQGKKNKIRYIIYRFGLKR